MKISRGLVACALWVMLAGAPPAIAAGTNKAALQAAGSVCAPGGGVNVGGWPPAGSDVQIGSNIASCDHGSGPGNSLGVPPPCFAGQVRVLPPDATKCWVVEVAYGTSGPAAPGGATCVQYVGVVVGAPDQTQSAFDAFARSQVAALGWCPVIPSPSQTAANFFTTRHLSAPTLSIQPGEAIAGLLAYLQIGGPTAATFVVPDGFGDTITITAQGSYEVAWGDGVTDSVGTDHGGPYPSGDVTHAYQWAGHPTVTVTETWAATWTSTGTLGDLGGEVPARLTVGSLPDFPVREVQANRNQ